MPTHAALDPHGIVAAAKWNAQKSAKREAERPATPRISSIDLPLEDGELSPEGEYDDEMAVDPPPGIGPFEILCELFQNKQGSVVKVMDISRNRVLCFKKMIIDKPEEEQRSLSEAEAKALEAFEVEMTTYKRISESKQCRFILDCHGVIRCGRAGYFAMVSERIVPVAALVMSLMHASRSRIISRKVWWGTYRRFLIPSGREDGLPRWLLGSMRCTKWESSTGTSNLKTCWSIAESLKYSTLAPHTTTN